MNSLLEEDRLVVVGGPAPDMRGAFAADVRAGLSAPSKRLSCRYLYDAEGSRLFDEICRLPEYYPTRTEAAILKQLAPELVERMGDAPQLVELGSGSAEKTRTLIEAFLVRHGALQFVPIDISVDALRESSRGLLADFEDLRIHAIASDYLAALRNLPPAGDAARLVLWLGSSIGNFDREAARSFLADLRTSFGARDALLVGIDLRKDAAVVEPAYDDAAGVTARFNRNLLVRINREFGANFEPEHFAHRATYDVALGCIQSYLVARCAMRVSIPDLDLSVEFQAGEAIHTENSHKYDPAEIETLIARAGFALERQWLDPARLFSVSLLVPR